MSYNVPDIDIDFKCENEEQVKKYLPRLNTIRDSFKGKKWTIETKSLLQHEILNIQHYIQTYEESDNITVEIKGPAAYNETTWSLEELLKYYKKYYPERYEDKETYTRIEVNNILFDLEIMGVIRGYECVAIPYAETYNNQPFSWDKTILLGEKYNLKETGLHIRDNEIWPPTDLVMKCDLNKLMED